MMLHELSSPRQKESREHKAKSHSGRVGIRVTQKAMIVEVSKSWWAQPTVNQPYTGSEEVVERRRGRTEPRIPSQKLMRGTTPAKKADEQSR